MLTDRELFILAGKKLLLMKPEEIKEFVKELIPAAEAAKEEGANGPQPFRN